jgi:peptide/nickel transport system permease protein
MRRKQSECKLPSTYVEEGVAVNDRLAYALKRLALTVPMLLFMSVLVFLILHLVPGDPVRAMLGISATPQSIAVARHQLGLNLPLSEQYFRWLGQILHGNLGRDYASQKPVDSLIAAAFPITFELTLLTMIVTVGVGVPLGIVAATKRNWASRSLEGLVVAGVAIPNFWLGLTLVVVFTGTFKLLPPFGYVSFTANPVDNLRDMVLPVATLAAAQIAYVLHTTQGAMRVALGSTPMLFHRAKGLRERTIVYRHALRNASGPIVTVIGLQFGYLIGGVIVIETLFGLPGLGQLIVNAINSRDYTVVQGGVVVVAGLFILITLTTDLLCAWLDPRILENRGAR